VKYIEIAKESPNKRGIIIPLSDLRNHIEPQQELYRSYYTYDDNILEHRKLYKTVKGYEGILFLDNIIIDIDKKESTDEDVLFRTQLFVERLCEDWKFDRNELRIWYSGRGYHIVFPDIFKFNPSPFIADEVKATLTKYFPEMDSMPLMKTGLIRVGFSYNAKTKRYKTPISAIELFSLKAEDIIKLSETFGIRKVERDRISSVPDFSHLKVSTVSKKKKEIEGREEPTRIVTCAQTMFDQGAAALEGDRHKILVRLVGSWLLAGMSYKGAKILAESWNNGSMTDYDLDKHFNYNWDKGYTPGCDDEIRLKFCSDKCIHFKAKNYVTEILDSKTMEESFTDFMKKDYSRTSFDLTEIYKLRDNQSYRIYPGEHVIVLGETKLGKTAFAQNLCVKLPRMRILYLSLEVNDRLLFRRFIQIAYGMTKGEVMEHYEKGGESLIDRIEHIQVMTTAPELDNIERLVKRYRPQIVVIDTMDGIQVRKYNDGNAKTEQLGNQLKRIAQETDTIIISIHHISKSSSVNERGEPKELNIHSGKGSSAVEQKADRVIAVEGSLQTNVRLIRSLGTRDDESFAIQVQFNASTTFTMEQLF
jgi:KaiC/GvpD/RAD55 family RecA-like ATPase